MQQEGGPSSGVQLEQGKPYVGYVKEEDYYFDGYSHFSIHEEMLKDKIRTKSYMRAILDNPDLFRDKVVLDIGSGTGILSIFAAKSGAKHVYGIEKASIYLHSRNIIKENNFEDTITIINGLVQEVELPVESVDVIISEWMGYFLLYEAMFDSVLFARDKWLKPEGIMLPDRARMYIAVIDDGVYYRKKLNFWNNIYGISMKCMQKWVLSEPIVDPIDCQDILSDTHLFYDIDLRTVTLAQLQFRSEFEVKVEEEGGLFGFVSWFDCDFSHGERKVVLSTSPFKKQTHWKQTVFYVEQPQKLKVGERVKGSLNVAKAKDNPRQLNVCIKYIVEGETNQSQKVQYYRIS